MANIFDGFLKQLGTGDQIKDFKHASRLFVDNNYALSPKYGWLYHVFFDIDPQFAGVMKDHTKLVETGMLVKNVDLPKFGIESKTLNAYNRPNIVQTKVKYNPVSFTFHDDQSNVIRNFWYDYYNFYYRDMDIGYANSAGDINPTYYQKSKYIGGDRSQFNRFGYSPKSNGSNGNQFIKAIRIYSLHQKRFTEYTLVNPIIADFSHGTHDAAANGGMESNMTIQYETVLYESGYVSSTTVKGFAELHYDKSPSPLTPAGGGTNSILGPGGMVSAIDAFLQNPAKGAFGLFRSYEKNKNTNLKGLASTELLGLATQVLSGQDPRSTIFVPTTGAYSTRSSQVSGTGGPNVVGGGATSNGSSIGLGTGALLTGIAIAAGTKSPAAGVLGAVALNTVLNMTATGTPTSTEPIYGFNFLAGKLAKYEEDKKAKQKAEEAKAAQAQSSGYAAAAAASAKYEAQTQGVSSSNSVPEGATTYTTGTNIPAITGIQGGNGTLAQTPNGGYVSAGSAPETASSEAAKFTNNGNPTQLQPAQSYAGNHMGTSTSPEPASVPPQVSI